MAKEIEVASQIQKTLLPHELPGIPGLEVDAFYRAASLVGGDLYDVFKIGDERYCLAVADVSGKGVPASLVMSMLRTVLQIYAGKASSARETLLMANEYLCKNMPPGMFITVLLAIYDASTRKLSVVSAGHNPMLHFQPGRGGLSKVNPGGMPLGVDVTLDHDFASGLQQIVLELEPGDIVFMYTDGITEAIGRDRQQYGAERLSRFLSDRFEKDPNAPLGHVAHAIVDEIDDFSGFARQGDDITFILCRVQPVGQDSYSASAVSSRKLPDTTLSDQSEA